jgi:hypothetical protein
VNPDQLTLSDAVGEKASDIFEQHRVILRQPWAADVLGDSGWHRVIFTYSGWRCSCKARVSCSHGAAAALAYAESQGAQR